MAQFNGTKIKELTQEQKNLLKDELAKPEYNGLKIGELWKKLHLIPAIEYIENPEPQGTVAKPPPTKDELINNLTASEYLAICEHEAVGKPVITALNSVTKLDVNSILAQGLILKLTEASLLTQERINELINGQIPDPDYQAQIPDPNQDVRSPVEKLFGAGWAVEGSDIRELI
jgi:hypothetical protein